MNRECAMTTAAATVTPIAWWKEPTKDQWYAYVAAWAGWTLDAFDFTAFLLIIAPIAKEFNVPVPEVAAVLTITLWMRLLGATASGWLADRFGRKTPLMISIAWYSACNFIAGFSPTFWFLFLFRALLGIGMGAEWPAGAALAMEQWPIRSRGFMGGVFDRRAVSDLSPKGSGPQRRAGGAAGHAPEPGVFYLGFVLGLVCRPRRPPLGDHHPGLADDPDRARLSPDHRLHDDRGVFR